MTNNFGSKSEHQLAEPQLSGFFLVVVKMQVVFLNICTCWLVGWLVGWLVVFPLIFMIW